MELTTYLSILIRGSHQALEYWLPVMLAEMLCLLVRDIPFEPCCSALFDLVHSTVAVWLSSGEVLSGDMSDAEADVSSTGIMACPSPRDPCKLKGTDPMELNL